jgi:4-hydroxy-tetrahydrodipicolinate reductase
MISLVLHGASGRMGEAIKRLGDQRFKIIAGLDADSSAEDFKESLAAADLVIDFTAASALDRLFDALKDNPCALVSGTTGLSDQQERRLQDLAQTMPVLWASNMSLGVAVLHALVAQAARQLADWDLEIVETHHRHKLDAPSGTALTLAQSAAAQRPGSTIVCGRAGEGRRHPGQIGVQALRGGTVVGHHQVHLFGAGEQVTLSHRAESREQFARGALRAGYWLSGRTPGLYSLDQMLGL